ncbi:MAG: DNA-protecting protein DprA [Candidatus Sungbacteria bacterium]|nr:DNA-protecting protein DprA [Candidatus Sungbacteria bacterium]
MSTLKELSILDPSYSKLLKETHSAPEKLFVRGNFNIKPDDWTIAIVGTRKPTEYGRTIARRFAEDLARAGAVIISGLATGIDSEAHRGALKAGGKTVAVIGSGLDRASFFPSANWSLAETIAKENGTVISEYAEGTPALPHHFPERNRIIAGLSQGVIVVEAQEKSGASITARLALEENRDVFAVPGSIFSPTSALPNRLIKEGATPITSADDVMDFYGKTKSSIPPANGSFNGLEAIIIEALSEPRTIDDLKQMTKAETGPLQASLSLLELNGTIAEIAHGQYQKI